ncbi:MAG: CPBP family glutamic-type intramembrane protease [Actinomycetota bacterium]
MPAGVVALAVGGPLAVAAAWVTVGARKLSVWAAMGILMPVLGGLSLATGWVTSVGPGRSAAGWAVLGLGAGVALYAATAGFMSLAGRWPPLARHTESLYGERRSISLPGALSVSVLLVVPGEELLWRGVVMSSLEHALEASILAAVLQWSAYVTASLFSRSIPIVLSAVVGGAAWTALAWWSGGVVAALSCHGVWTALMVARPPVPRRIS